MGTLFTTGQQCHVTKTLLQQVSPYIKWSYKLLNGMIVMEN